jgi:hypothetical protein
MSFKSFINRFKFLILLIIIIFGIIYIFFISPNNKFEENVFQEPEIIEEPISEDPVLELINSF